MCVEIDENLQHTCPVAQVTVFIVIFILVEILYMNFLGQDCVFYKLGLTMKLSLRIIETQSCNRL